MVHGFEQLRFVLLWRCWLSDCQAYRQSVSIRFKFYPASSIDVGFKDCVLQKWVWILCQQPATMLKCPLARHWNPASSRGALRSWLTRIYFAVFVKWRVSFHLIVILLSFVFKCFFILVNKPHHCRCYVRVYYCENQTIKRYCRQDILCLHETGCYKIGP